MDCIRLSVLDVANPCRSFRFHALLAPRRCVLLLPLQKPSALNGINGSGAGGCLLFQTQAL
jgi:hypothetical protein